MMSWSFCYPMCIKMNESGMKFIVFFFPVSSKIWQFSRTKCELMTIYGCDWKLRWERRVSTSLPSQQNGKLETLIM